MTATITTEVLGWNVEPRWRVGRELVNAILGAIEDEQLTPLEGARLISSITATLSTPSGS